jgi:hypothetical protein
MRFLNGLRWDDIYSKFHENRFGHLSNITVTTATICEDVMLVLLMGRIYDLAVEMDSRVNIYIPTFIKICSGIQKLLVGIHRHTDSKVIS